MSARSAHPNVQRDPSNADDSITGTNNDEIDPDEENTLIARNVDRVVEAKMAVQSQLKLVCRDIEQLHRVSNEYSKDVRRLELEIESMPVIEDWIRTTVSEIAQLKSQIRFMHNIIDK